SSVRDVFAEVARRHASLRTYFADTEDESGGSITEQLVRESVVFASGFTFPVVDMGGLGENRTALDNVSQDIHLRSFDFGTGPLLRAVVLRETEDSHRLVIVQNHFVSDGWAIGVLLNEFGALYNQYVEGSPSALANLPVQYGDYAVWQRERLQGGEYRKQVR